MRKHLFRSLEALQVKTLDLWYLHAPDRTVPFEETFKVVNDLYKEGHFKALGISNYAAFVPLQLIPTPRDLTPFSWEVAEIVGICRANGYIQPTVYQGIYNAVHRSVEVELFPALRKYGIKFYAFNPCLFSQLSARSLLIFLKQWAVVSLLVDTLL